MATIDKTGGGPLNGSVPYAASHRVYVAKAVVDLTGGAITDNDIYQCLAIPANTLVMNVKVKILTPAVGTSLAMDVGITGDNGWDDAIDGKAAAGTVTSSAVGTDAYAASAGQGTFYSTADSIDVTMEAASSITAGPKFEIMALCADYS